MVDSKGVVHVEREGLGNQYKARYAAKTEARSLADAMVGRDIFLGVSVADTVTQDMIKSMAPNPIIMALANPDPEIRPELVKEVSPNSIIATGRSDYPNQVNNVLCFPFMFRGALDVGATTINNEMKALLVTGSNGWLGKAVIKNLITTLIYILLQLLQECSYGFKNIEKQRFFNDFINLTLYLWQNYRL